MKWTDFQEYSIYQYYILIETVLLIKKKMKSASHKNHTRLQPSKLHLRFIAKHFRKSDVNLTEAPPETRKRKPLSNSLYMDM